MSYKIKLLKLEICIHQKFLLKAKMHHFINFMSLERILCHCFFPPQVEIFILKMGNTDTMYYTIIKVLLDRPLIFIKFIMPVKEKKNNTESKSSTLQNNDQMVNIIPSLSLCIHMNANSN